MLSWLAKGLEKNGRKSMWVVLKDGEVIACFPTESAAKEYAKGTKGLIVKKCAYFE